MTDSFDAYGWIVSKVPYGRDLQKVSYDTVASLAVLCAYFEQEHGNHGGGKAALRTCANAARVHGGLTAPLQDALAFWQGRYVERGHLNPNFRTQMNWRSNDDRATVEAVLLGHATAPNDQVMALLTIVYRLRNNLFHGLKGIGELNHQRENLAVACTALSSVMELL